MAKRDWEITNDERFETEEGFRQAVINELILAENAGHRLGYGVFYAPIRQRIEDEHGRSTVVTLGARFESFPVPLVPGKPQQAGPLPETPKAEPEEDMIAMVGPGGEEATVPESEVSDLMEQGWKPDEEIDDPEPAVIAGDPYAE